MSCCKPRTRCRRIRRRCRSRRCWNASTSSRRLPAGVRSARGARKKVQGSVRADRGRRGRGRGARVHALDDAVAAEGDSVTDVRSRRSTSDRGGGPDDAGRVSRTSRQSSNACRHRRRRSAAPAGAGRGGRPGGRRNGHRLAAARPVQRRRARDRRASRTASPPDAAFAAVSGGGIWKTTDGGANWTSVWPDSNTQTMGAFAQAPTARCGPAPARPTRPAAA